jgi:hypothetical protein
MAIDGWLRIVGVGIVVNPGLIDKPCERIRIESHYNNYK